MIVLLAGFACGAPAPLVANGAGSGPAETFSGAVGESTPPPMADPGPIPITQSDATWGNPLAPVTLVEFADFASPPCARVGEKLAELRTEYGPDKLRIVFKHYPLTYHAGARAAAELSQVILKVEGPDAFWAFHDRAFAGRLNEDRFPAIARASGFPPDRIPGDLAEEARRKVDADTQLAESLKVTGVPASFVNGHYVNGNQPIDSFRAVIDEELRETALALEKGIEAHAVVAHRTAINLSRASDPPLPKRVRAIDPTVFLVPVDGSPARGPRTALVTMVMFSDFQCAFCLKSLPTIETLLAKYGADLRIVYKHHPLVFHKRAEPAAQLAIVAFREQGDAGFWKAHDALFAQHEQLGSSELAVLAGTLGLDPGATMKAVATHEHQSIIDKDQLLALDLEVFGTPQFFVNGRRVVGARSQEEFEELIDEELAKARALVERGTPREQVYATIMKDALPGFPPPRISIAGPSPTHPSRGPKNAPVVIQVFGDLEDELSAHVVPTLARLMEAFPKDVRVVFRHRPSPLHPASPMAAQATIEALAQNGNAGFWKLHDRLFEHYRDDLTREALDGHARAVGLDVPRLRKALDDGTHVAAMQADVDVAETAGIRSPPGFVINGYLMKGKQTLDRFKRVVLLALDDAAQGRTSP